jgi:hypothetical protein
MVAGKPSEIVVTTLAESEENKEKRDSSYEDSDLMGWTIPRHLLRK